MLLIRKVVFDILRELRIRYDHTEVSGYLLADSNAAGSVYTCNSIYVLHPFSQSINARDKYDLFEFKEEDARSVNTDCSTSSDFRADIVFHTHPEYCYIHHKTWLGIPSRADVIQSVINFKKFGHKINIISSVEGFYILILKSDAQKDILKNGIKKHVDVLTHMYDSLGYSNYTYLDNTAQIHTIKFLLDQLNDTGFFDARFYPYSMDVLVGEARSGAPSPTTP